MKTKRDPLSKRTRFEIFKRDLFTCQYCGEQPPNVVLEIDHIDPVSLGGDNHELNLLTSCADCNASKSNKPLTDRIIRPDADLRYLETQQEIAEARRFLVGQRELDSVRASIVEVIQDHWNRVLKTDDSVPAEHVILGWLSRYAPEEITEAINCSASAFHSRPWSFRNFDSYLKYVSGVMRNRRELLG